MAGINDLVGFDFPVAYTSGQGSPIFNSDGTATIPNPGFGIFSDKDLGQVGSNQVTAVDLTQTSPGVLGTMSLINLDENGNPTGNPTNYNIVAVNNDQILLSFQSDTSTYFLLSNVDISQTDDVTASNPTGDEPDFPITLTTTSVSSYVALNGPVPCFARGTRIATPAGEIAVETLRVGDLVVTASGDHQPIVWVGSRSIKIIRHRNPDQVRPVIISANAFDENIPRRDLVLSPDHNIFVNGVLIPAKCLVNGVTVTQLDAAEVTYHHIELSEHDVVLAEGLATESYLDTGNRVAFADHGTTVLHPDFASQPDLNYFAWDAKGCAPLVLAGLVVDCVRERLARRANSVGAMTVARDAA